MRFRTCQRTVVLLAALLAVQGGASAVADGKDPGRKPDRHTPSGPYTPPNPHTHPGPHTPPGPPGRSGSIDPLSPFTQGASTFARMAAPFTNAASEVMFPRH
ncbi:hypothetical protein ABZ626_09650 [Streptomyces longispororuber]|uniref:hypothetical protein n=1 Tax=Streptomyces longispororuber TaxID=68230 RepID=UPI0033DA2380